MKLCILILKEEEKFNDLLSKLTEKNFNRVTSINSNSYITEKGKNIKKHTNIFASLKNMMDYYNDESKTILIPCEKEKLNDLQDIIKNISSSDKYVLYVLPLDSVWGI